MASSKDYLEYILDQLSGLDDIDSVSDDQRTADTISKLKSRYISVCRLVRYNGFYHNQFGFTVDIHSNVSRHVETIVQLSKGRWTSGGRPFSADRSRAETISSEKIRVEFDLEDMDMSGFG